MTKVTLQAYIVNKQLDGAVKFRLVPLLSITRVSYIQDFIMSGTLVVSHINPLYYMNFMLVLRPGEICLYVYPLYIFPSIFFYFKALQDTVFHKCKKIAWKLSIYLDARSIYRDLAYEK